jgi:hypothetical protein
MSPTLGTTLFPTTSRTAICTFLHHEIFFSKIFSFGQFVCLDQLAESVPNLALWLVELAGEFVESEVLQTGTSCYQGITPLLRAYRGVNVENWF